ncbi:pilus assembly protein [Sphingorhabdus sp. IMCC26285]|jgi:Flp pilus assembly protein TadG|uniref:Pilus assembly protein n=1 Tax=Sphingorhabdus profundilacus TaxID=2509718 RepID=A0A6I4LV63_9SPHN|nr:TadE family protein [Sphingorhabdus profundilacus]MVZ96729.1 pilus assembly protein [Sphingorhabdus profundilacus]
MLTKFRRPFVKVVKDCEGTSIVEFAVISPVMFTLLFGGFDFGHTLYMKSVLQGAINKAARDSALETGTVAEVQAAVDQKVIDQVTAVHRTAEFDTDSFSRSYFRTFTDAAFPESEVWDDTNSDGECNNDENYIDENNNSTFDADGIADGQGYTRDAVKYSATVRYDRLFPLAGLLGISNRVELTASTVIANQPYGQKAAAITRKCEDA